MRILNLTEVFRTRTLHTANLRVQRGQRKTIIKVYRTPNSTAGWMFFEDDTPLSAHDQLRVDYLFNLQD